MNEVDLVVAALCMANPFCAVAGLLSGLFWRIHFVLGGIATLGTIWLLTIGLMPIMLAPTIAAAILWTVIGSGVAGLFLGRRRSAELAEARGHATRLDRTMQSLERGAL